MSRPGKSQWNKWLSSAGRLRVVAIEASELLAQLSGQQGLTGFAQRGYAEALIGSLLIASPHKSNESINMNAQGSGAFKQAIIDASPEGRVRGFLIEEKDASMHSFGPAETNGPWGSGVLSILYTKNFEGKHPYKGMVAISTGYLDEAINDYYRDSEQMSAKVGLAVDFEGANLTPVCGVLIQALGGATPEEIQLVNDLPIEKLRLLAALAGEPGKFIQRASELLNGAQFQLLENKELIGFCNCSQERIERALVLTGEEESMAALGEDPYITMTCDFCRSEYRVSRERLKALFAQDPSHLQ